MPKAKPKVAHTCRQCGETFFAHLSQNRKFCSRECTDLNWGHQAEFTCRECGQVFVDGASQNRKYCSSECYQAFNKVRIADGVAYIELTTQKREFVADTVIDLKDLERVRALGCRVHPAWSIKRQEYRAYTKVNGSTYALHRFIMDAPPDVEVDHISGDTLDNRRSANLRLVTKSENMQNRKGATKLSGSGKRNVYWHEGRCKYQVKMQIDGKPYHVGYFATLEEADNAAIAARRKFMTHSER